MFGPVFDRRARDVLGPGWFRSSASASLHIRTILSRSSSSSSPRTPSSSSSVELRVIDEACEAISSPSKFLFFKLPIQKTDEHLLAARAAFTLNTSCSTVSRTAGIWATIAEILISYWLTEKCGVGMRLKIGTLEILYRFVPLSERIKYVEIWWSFVSYGIIPIHVPPCLWECFQQLAFHVAGRVSNRFACTEIREGALIILEWTGFICSQGRRLLFWRNFRRRSISSRQLLLLSAPKR